MKLLEKNKRKPTFLIMFVESPPLKNLLIALVLSINMIHSKMEKKCALTVKIKNFLMQE